MCVSIRSCPYQGKEPKHIFDEEAWISESWNSIETKHMYLYIYKCIVKLA